MAKKKKLTLDVGVERTLEEGVMGLGIIYAGMPSPKVFSLVVRQYDDSCAYNLYFPKSQEKIEFEDHGHVIVKRVTPKQIMLQYVR